MWYIVKNKFFTTYPSRSTYRCTSSIFGPMSLVGQVGPKIGTSTPVSRSTRVCCDKRVLHNVPPDTVFPRRNYSAANFYVNK